ADDCCDARGYDQFCDTSCPRARRTLELAAERAPQGEPLEPCAYARSERDPDRSERLAGKTDALQQEHQPCTDPGGKHSPHRRDLRGRLRVLQREECRVVQPRRRRGEQPDRIRCEHRPDEQRIRALELTRLVQSTDENVTEQDERDERW